ncbi:mucin-binding protein, partial [Limosilactobacillus fermentum]
TRTVEEDLVTGAKTYSQWTTDTWPSFTVPSVAGYTASPTVVPALVVKDGDGDVTVTIAYTKLVPNS